jgi:hypothetical protein
MRIRLLDGDDKRRFHAYSRSYAGWNRCASQVSGEYLC